MINFALACRLKEAGFPQYHLQHRSGHYWLDGENDWWHTLEVEITDTESVYCPTLSELIEQCGGKAFRLSSGAYMDPELGWMARNEMVQGMEILDYPSPEEAVANLYLTIHKKS